MVRVVGAARPHSNREMSDLAMPVSRESSAWVIPRSRRNSNAWRAISLGSSEGLVTAR
jgi:hypothetical protein